MTAIDPRAAAAGLTARRRALLSRLTATPGPAGPPADVAGAPAEPAGQSGDLVGAPADPPADDVALPPAGPPVDLAGPLDAGELVLVADLLAAWAGDDARPLPQRRDLLGEAADCLADARNRREPRFTSERGRAAYRREPDRFDPERLAATEEDWRARVREWDVRLAEPAGQAIAVLTTQLEPILRALAADLSGGVIQELRPRAGDYGKIFVPAVVEVARERFEELWAGPLDFRHPAGPAPARVAVVLAPAGRLAAEHEGFPDGYCAIAHLLQPARVWAAWRYPSAGLAYNGLVWCDDHWAWLPKPYRVLPI